MSPRAQLVRTKRGTPAPGARGAAKARAAPARGGVVHLTAEYWPFARTGGLGEAVSGLASAQAAAGIPTVVVMPLYRMVRETVSLQQVGQPLPVPFAGREECVTVYRHRGARGPRVFFIAHPCFDRPGIYGADGADYPDNAVRFALFSRAALSALPRIAPGYRVLHAHDWHAALAPVYLRTDPAARVANDRLITVLSVHNAGFQGLCPPSAMAELGLAVGLYDWRYLESYGRVNLLKGGLTFCDLAATVSPTHARELCTAEGGFGLHDTFRGLGERLVGILNGIDDARWDPRTDPDIIAHYSADDLGGKAHCKAALQRAYHLPERPDVPVCVMSARLVAQKGLDIVLGADLLSGSEVQLVFLGHGEDRYHTALAALAAAAPDRVAVEFAFADPLEHRLLAGADILLMPSLYEPCGLTQMRAQCYGTIPVARRVGGLLDSIRDGETGFLFDAYAPDALTESLARAIGRFGDRSAWRATVQDAMSQPFAWHHPAARYSDLYERALAA